MKVENLFREKRPVISFEIFPPKRDTELQNIDGTLEILSRLNPDFISVTFGAGGSAANNKTIALAKKIKQEYGITPIVHLTCLNYSKSEIDEILAELEENEIENILALRGDHNPGIEPKKEFQYAADLVKYIKKKGDFDVSGACYPEGHIEAENLVADIHHLKEKVDAGASHLISQLFFDNSLFYTFQVKTILAGINVPIVAGIMPVINKAQIERMVTLCGASLPEKFRRIMNKYENDREALFDAGMAYAINQIVDLLAHDVDGIHIYTMNNIKVAERICKGIEHLI